VFEFLSTLSVEDEKLLYTIVAVSDASFRGIDRSIDRECIDHAVVALLLSEGML
jgi:hypothetical protein